MKTPTALICHSSKERRDEIIQAISGAEPSFQFQESDSGPDAMNRIANQKYSWVVAEQDFPRKSAEDILEEMGTLSSPLRPDLFVIMTTSRETLSISRPTTRVHLIPADETGTELKNKFKSLFEAQNESKPSSAPKASAPKGSSGGGFDVSFINPFVDATIKVIQTTCSTQTTKEEVFVRQNDQISGDISAIIALNSSDYSGSVAVSFEKKCFLTLVGRMLDEEYTEITDEIQDAAGEICNQIFGQAKVVLNEKGHSIEKAIPSVIRGDNHSIKHLVEGNCVAIKFSTDVGSFTVEAVMGRK